MPMIPPRLVCSPVPRILGLMLRIAQEYAFLGVQTIVSARIPQDNAWRDATIGAHLPIIPPLSA